MLLSNIPQSGPTKRLILLNAHFERKIFEGVYAPKRPSVARCNSKALRAKGACWRCLPASLYTGGPGFDAILKGLTLGTYLGHIPLLLWPIKTKISSG